ncbi:MAG: type IV secretion protein Rhs [Saprospiraceae bacterium]|nr:MAG: type IV secretion protein Rhs [Saprospiraceae bacterium]
MNNDRIIQSEAVVKGCRDFVLLSDGKEIDPTIQVVSITVNKKVNKVSTARIVVKDGSTCEESFSVSDSDIFAPGKKIEIKAGRGGPATLVFSGPIIKISVKASSNGAQLTVECKDECIKMTVGRKNKYFKDKTDNEVIKEILGSYGLAGKLEKSNIKHKQITQSNATDWDFILSRAASIGMLLVPDDGKVNLVSPNDNGKPAISLIHGSTVVEFSAELDAKDQYPSVEASAEGPNGVVKVKTSSSPLQELGNIAGTVLSKVLGLEKFDLRHGARLPKQQLQAWADSTMLKSRLAKVKGSAKFKGFGAVKPGDVVSLGGVGKRFGGNAFVASTTQSFEPDSWTTSAEFGLDKGDWGGGGGGGGGGGESEDQSRDLNKSVKGLRTGKVMGLAGADVMVSIPIIGPIAAGVKARHAVLDAGPDRGTYWQPEPGDEVIVGFLNEDPSQAVVLGCLFNGAPPLFNPANIYKGIVSKNNLRLVFDDLKKIITIWTPDGNQLELNDTANTITLKDKPSNGNRIIMNKDGIIIESGKDIIMKAPKGKITVDADKNCIVKSKKNLSLVAKEKVVGSGQKGLELMSQNKIQIKGSEVHLNPPKPPKKPKEEKPKEIPKKTDSEGGGLVA